MSVTREALGNMPVAMFESADGFKVAAGATVGAGLMTLREKFFKDKKSDVFTASNMEGLSAILEIHRMNGQESELDLGDDFVPERAAFDGGSKIVNLASEEVDDTLGNPSGAMMLRSKDPDGSAKAAVEYLHEIGFDEAKVLEYPDPDMRGKMSFIDTGGASRDIIIGFRVHKLRMQGLKPPRRWKNRNKKS